MSRKVHRHATKGLEALRDARARLRDQHPPAPPPMASQGNAGPPQVSLTPTGGGLGGAQPWGRSARPEPSAAELAGLPTDDDRALFRAVAAGASPLPRPAGPKPAGLEPIPPAPIPLQREQDERSVLREAMSDELGLDHLLETDHTLSWRREGIGADTLRKLRRGHWMIQSELDLHGLRRDEAREALGQFLRAALARKLRCVRIIHGKGLSSPLREPVLKYKVRNWLMQRDEVLAYVQARPSDGGAGALVLLLRSARRTEGLGAGPD